MVPGGAPEMVPTRSTLEPGKVQAKAPMMMMVMMMYSDDDYSDDSCMILMGSLVVLHDFDEMFV